MALKKVPQQSGKTPKHPLSALVDVGEPLDINMALDYLIGNFVRLSGLEEDRRQAAVYLINKIREFAELQEEESKEQCPDIAATLHDLIGVRCGIDGVAQLARLAMMSGEGEPEEAIETIGPLLEALSARLASIGDGMEKGAIRQQKKTAAEEKGGDA